MNLETLEKAVTELRQHRATIDRSITSLEETISVLREAQVGAPNVRDRSCRRERRSYIEDAIDVLQKNGAPMHIKAIIEKMGETGRAKISRGSVESSIIRHIDKAVTPALARFGASTFGLTTWKSSPALVQTA